MMILYKCWNVITLQSCNVNLMMILRLWSFEQVR